LLVQQLKYKASASRCSFEFKLWQDEERNIDDDRLNQRRLERALEKILKMGGLKVGVKSGAQKSERTRAKRRSAGVR
jgi:hypothetical protein